MEAFATFAEQVSGCTRCRLSQGRTQVVFGVGNPHADLMFVGEAPGFHEDKQGVPFVGRAGQLLTKMIEAMGFARDDVYIANVVKCRPPENRNPEPDEIESCEPFLFRQIESVRPKVIIALGAFAVMVITTFAHGPVAMWSLILVGLFHSIMFPTIFTLGIKGLGPLTEEGSGLLIMAIAGGALVVVQGKLADHFGLQWSFLLTAACELYTLFYALWGSRPTNAVDARS